jgi:YbbR domain-containing protein
VAALSGFLSRNWTLKVAAFGVALILWVAVRAETPTRQEFLDIPLRVEVGDPEWVLAEAPTPSAVTVRLGGPSRELLSLAMDPPTVVIPMETVTSPDTSVSLSNAWVRMQDRPGVVVEAIQPASVRLSLEPIERATLPVALRLEGSLPSGFAMAGPPVSFPDRIRVSGPRSLMQELDSIPLLPLDLSEVTQSGLISVGVDTSAVAGLEVQPRSVDMEIPFEDRVQRVMSGIPIVLPSDLREQAAALELRPSTASVIVQGARSLVDRADPTVFELVVRVEPDDLPQPGEEAEFPVALEGLPPLVGGQPQQAVVMVRRLQLESRR